jgi:hypothetical protein
MDLKLLISIFAVSMSIFSAYFVSNAYSIKFDKNNHAIFQQQSCHNGSCTVTNCSNDNPCKTSTLNSTRSSTSSSSPSSSLDDIFSPIQNLFP